MTNIKLFCIIQIQWICERVENTRVILYFVVSRIFTAVQLEMVVNTFKIVRQQLQSGVICLWNVND